MQNEITYGGDDVSLSPRLPPQHQPPQSTPQYTNTSGYSLPSVGLSLRTSLSDQTKNMVFSNALSSPVRRSLQPYHLAQSGEHLDGVLPPGNGTRNQEPYSSGQTREHTSFGLTDTSMDMHSDSPIREPYWLNGNDQLVWCWNEPKEGLQWRDYEEVLWIWVFIDL